VGEVEKKDGRWLDKIYIVDKRFYLVDNSKDGNLHKEITLE
jgi:hypothetical protein